MLAAVAVVSTAIRMVDVATRAGAVKTALKAGIDGRSGMLLTVPVGSERRAFGTWEIGAGRGAGAGDCAICV
jgi:hypothetical protein